MQKFLHSGTYPVFQQHFPQNQTHKKYFSDFLAIIPPFYPKIRLKGLYLHIIIYQTPMRKNIFLFAAILSAFAFTSLCTPQAVAQKKSYTKKISQPRNEYVVANKHHMFMIGIMEKKEKPISIIELGKRNSNSCRFKQYNSEAF